MCSLLALSSSVPDNRGGVTDGRNCDANLSKLEMRTFSAVGLMCRGPCPHGKRQARGAKDMHHVQCERGNVHVPRPVRSGLCLFSESVVDRAAHCLVQSLPVDWSFANAMEARVVRPSLLPTNFNLLYPSTLRSCIRDDDTY